MYCCVHFGARKAKAITILNTRSSNPILRLAKLGNTLALLSFEDLEQILTTFAADLSLIRAFFCHHIPGPLPPLLWPTFVVEFCALASGKRFLLIRPNPQAAATLPVVFRIGARAWRDVVRSSPVVFNQFCAELRPRVSIVTLPQCPIS